VNTFTDKITLTKGQTAANGGTGTGSPLGVQGVNVKREMNGSVIANVSKSHLNNTTDTVTKEPS
jgi:hypothetical protein